MLIPCCKDTFASTYIDPFLQEYPFVNVEVLTVDSLIDPRKPYFDQVAAIIREERPDLVQLFGSSYQALAGEGALKPLETLLKDRKFDAGGIHPAVLESLEKLGDGELYGLSPYFTSYAVFYNRDLFDAAGVAYPENHMSWEEVFALAAQFSETEVDGKRVAGLYHPNSPITIIREIGITNGLTEFDVSQALTIDSKSWLDVWNLVVDGERERVLRSNATDGTTDLFLAGEAAMTLNHFYYPNELQKSSGSFAWGVVTVPVDPNQRTKSSLFGLHDIFSIPVVAENEEAAWGFLAYVNGESYAAKMSKSTLNLLSRTDFVADKYGIDISPFYILNPSENNFFTYRLPLEHQQAIDRFNAILDEEARRAIRNEKETEQAIADAMRQLEPLLAAEEGGSPE